MLSYRDFVNKVRLLLYCYTMARPRGSTGRKQLTTEQRQRIRTLHFDARMTNGEIASITGATPDQIRYTIRAESAAVAHRSGRPRVLTPEQEAELVEFVCASRKNRRMTFLQLSLVLFAGIFGVWAIKHALYRLGFRRRVARRKPPITEENRVKRLNWALEHVNWTPEQWAKILWTDETWIVGGPHRKQYVTRREGEEWDDTCIVERHIKKPGWMFWGCFSGATGKGPGVFWEKDWGTINQESYRQHTVPVIDGWIRLCREEQGEELVLMQDGAPGHAAATTRRELRDRGVTVILWPPYSPDLNPIETVWNWMKDYIEDKYGDIEKPSYDQLRKWVWEAWYAVPEDWLKELLASMSSRCQAVIEANGMHTKY